MAKSSAPQDSRREFKLKINDLKRDSISMARLAQYMSEFARLLGSTERVHFDRLEDGSAVLVSEVEGQDEPKVSRRLELVKLGGGVADARTAFRNIDDMLAQDNTDGVVIREKNNLIEFPGKNRPHPEIYEIVTQEDSLDGVLITIGGRDSTVPVHIQNTETQDVYKCTTSREWARKMAPYLFGPPLRVFGLAEWKRDDKGKWSLKDLVIDYFLPLHNDSADDVFTRLRLVAGNDWDKVEDPYALLHKIRYGDEEAS